MMEIISQKQVKARKQHECSLCNNKIEKGQLYETSFIVDCGDHWEWKECIPCIKIRQFLIKESYLDQEYTDCEFCDAVREYIRDKELAPYDDDLTYKELFNVLLNYINELGGE